MKEIKSCVVVHGNILHHQKLNYIAFFKKQCFHLFINEEIIHIIISCTNKKTKEFHSTNAKDRWNPLDRTELNAFFELLLLIRKFREF